MNRNKLAILAAIAVLMALYFYLDLGRYMTLEALKNNRKTLAGFYETHQAACITIFICIYVIQTALSLPGAAILSISAGAIFGTVTGTICAVTGATIGATLAFLVTRYLFHDAVERRVGSRLARLNRELNERGLNYLLFLRLVPVFPFFLINLGAGLTRMPLKTFFFGTAIGIIPGGFVFCNAGANLASIASLRDVASPRVFGSFALLGLFALLPVLYHKLHATHRWPETRDRR